MQDDRTNRADWLVGNPVYVLSAAAMMYGVTLLLRQANVSAGDVGQILQAYGALQVYELALIAMAAWVLLRLVVTEDGMTLLVLECLLLGGSFIALDELLAAATSFGLYVAGAGLALAATKLAAAQRATRIPIGVLSRASALVLIAFPLAWVPWMKAAVSNPLDATWLAFAAWVALAAVLLVLLAIAGRSLRRQGNVVAAGAILAGVATLTAGAHLYSLHHSFLASSCMWYPAPALIVLGGAACVLVQLRASSSGSARFFAWWFPLLPLLLFVFDQSCQDQAWQSLPSVYQPLTLCRWLVAFVYALIMLALRQPRFVLPLAVAVILALDLRGRAIAEIAWDHRGWCLVLVAFGLLAAGGWVSSLKHRRRLRYAAQPQQEAIE